jgi:tetratricopeptide (TPR) repeat protein
MSEAEEAANSTRLERLLGFLERDPANPSLLTDAASTAFNLRQFDVAHELLGRLGTLGPLPPSSLNLRALVAIASSRFDDAAADLALLRDNGHNSPEIRFNLAWTRAMANRFDEAEALLDDEVMDLVPRAPALKIQMLQHLDRDEEALKLGAELAQRFPDNETLMGTLATVAMDDGNIELAEAYVARSGNSAEGLAAKGMFALDAANNEGALELFEHALRQQPANPRALIGQGLALLAVGKAAEAATSIDKGASIFGDHLGSWIASGWSHFIAGDLAKARESFERCIAIDPAFAEGQGGLAVMELMTGQLDKAKRSAEIALRLDRNSLGGVLAKSLLAQASGDTQAASRIREAAMSLPIGARGQTLAEMLAASGSRLLR